MTCQQSRYNVFEINDRNGIITSTETFILFERIKRFQMLQVIMKYPEKNNFDVRGNKHETKSNIC